MGRRTVGRSRAQFVLLLACLLTFPAICAHAQVFQTQDPGPGSVKVTGKWQFHTGDSPQANGANAPRWAQPGYNDAGWEQLRGDKTWGAQTHPGYTGFAWYRKRIDITGTNPKLDILIPPVDEAYEIYWNGKKIGSYGSLPPHAASWMAGHSAVYPLGISPLDGVLALRVWMAPLGSTQPATVGGLTASPVLGNPSVLALQAAAPRYRVEHDLLPDFLIGAVIFIAGLFALLLFLRDRKERLYLWLGIYLLTAGLWPFEVFLVVSGSLHVAPMQTIEQFANFIANISLWLLLLALFGLSREPRWRRWTAVLAALDLAASVVDIAVLFNWQYAGLGMQWTDAIMTAIYTLVPLYMLFIVGFGLARRKRLALWPLAIAVFLYGLWSFTIQILGQGVRFTHWTFWQHLVSWSLHLGSYRFSANFLLDTLLFVVLVFTVAQQQLQERRRQAQIDLEIKSAREVQQVLVPEEVPAIPGFSIASIYRPASEVGGDFYQVIPLGAGAVLVVVGDVSGKGLKAAMVVSLIVGSLRTLVDYTQEPAEILRGLNRRLIGRTHGGFATCIAMRIEADGTAVLSTAGHFAPYRDGKELPLDGALPLGIVPEAEYEEIVFRLHENETLTFYTDGIVEAMNAQRQLFGFDRIRELSRAKASAVQIAEEASAFGQEDDITVLTLTRLAATEPAHAAAVRLTTQIAAG